jgi:hypothetical protein
MASEPAIRSAPNAGSSAARSAWVDSSIVMEERV